MPHKHPVIKKMWEAAPIRADWRPVHELYQQIGETFHNSTTNIPQRLVLGQLAERFERITASYTGDEEEMVKHALGMMFHATNCSKGINTWHNDFWNLSYEDAWREAYFDKRFNNMGDYSIDHIRRRPKPFETVVETARRLRDLMGIRAALSGSGNSGAILGGSASYGRFFNVKGNVQRGDGSEPINNISESPKSSDVDLLVVVRDWDDLGALNLLSKVRGVSNNSLSTLIMRVQKFENVRGQISVTQSRNFLPISFSHRLEMWSEIDDEFIPLDREILSPRYDLSLHVVDRPTFAKIILEDVPIFKPDFNGVFSNSIYDYREETPDPGKVHKQRSFDGRELSQNELNPIEVDGGCVIQREAAFMTEDKYYPGFHQNLILPKFDVRWEDTEYLLEFRLDAFRWKLVERLRTEKAKEPFRIHRLSLSHTRSLDLAPHIVHKIDGD